MKRLLLSLFAILAIACFGLSGYGLYWMWKIKAPAIATTTDAFDKAGKWLNLADNTINDLKGNLEASRVQIAMVPRESNRAAGGAGFMETMIARTVARQVAPNIDSVQRTLSQVTEATIVVNSILDSLPEESTGPLDRLQVGQVRQLQDQLDGVSRASWDLSELLAPSGPGDNESPGAKAERIAASLAQIIFTVEDFQSRLHALQKRFEKIEKTTMYWLRVGPTIFTVVLIWVMISQLIVVAWVVSKWSSSEREAQV